MVLPLVPVMPIMVSSLAGWSKRLPPTTASARRVSATCTKGTSPSGIFSHSTQAAPFSRAMGMNLWPSATAPGTAMNRSPGSTSRESYCTSCMSVFRSALEDRMSSPASSSFNFMGHTPLQSVCFYCTTCALRRKGNCVPSVEQNVWFVSLSRTYRPAAR